MAAPQRPRRGIGGNRPANRNRNRPNTNGPVREGIGRGVRTNGPAQEGIGGGRPVPGNGRGGPADPDGRPNQTWVPGPKVQPFLTAQDQMDFADAWGQYATGVFDLDYRLAQESAQIGYSKEENKRAA